MRQDFLVKIHRHCQSLSTAVTKFCKILVSDYRGLPPPSPIPPSNGLTDWLADKWVMNSPQLIVTTEGYNDNNEIYDP